MTITITFSKGCAHIVYRVGERIEKQITLTTPKATLAVFTKMMCDAWAVLDRG